MTTRSKIWDIFYSGSHAFNGDMESVAKIAFLVDNGYLGLTVVRIAPKTEYAEILQDIHANPLHEVASGGGHAHVVLKILTGNYIKQACKQDVVFEHSFCGYYPDVLSKDKRIVAECGHTQNPLKMLDYFQQGQVRECIQIPYPDTEDTLIIGYQFSASSELSEFLELLEQRERIHAKDIFMKRSFRNS